MSCAPTSVSLMQEAFGVVVRVVKDDLTIVQNLVRLHLLEKSMCNNHIAAELMDSLSTWSGLERVRIVLRTCFRLRDRLVYISICSSEKASRVK